jgi:hypothetical protein
VTNGRAPSYIQVEALVAAGVALDGVRRGHNPYLLLLLHDERYGLIRYFPLAERACFSQVVVASAHVAHFENAMACVRYNRTNCTAHSEARLVRGTGCAVDRGKLAQRFD